MSAVVAVPEFVSIPLVVDLDGSLIKSDTLYESALALIKRNPVYVFACLAWLAQGKAKLKAELAARVDLDTAAIPMREDVLSYILAQKRLGRRIVLATASHRKYAEQIAAQLGIFDCVLATENGVNLSGDRKAERLVREFGENGFDYIGDSRKDLSVWRRARSALVVSAGQKLRDLAAAETPVHSFVIPRTGLSQYIRAMRVYQWVKNLLIAVPFITAHELGALAVLEAIVAFVAFSLCASSVYLLNDLFDLEADRRHATKRARPLASGAIPLLHGLLLVPLLLAASLLIAAQLSAEFMFAVLAYYGTTMAYSLYLKKVLMLDVILLAGLYTLRIIAGAIAGGLEVSFWLLAFSTFIFLSLAMIKRYAELIATTAPGDKLHGRRYEHEDRFVILAGGIAAGYLSVVVLSLYVNNPTVDELYAEPQVLWLLCPLLLYWINRMWIKTHRGEMTDDPIIYAVKDRVSNVLAVVVLVLIVLATV